MAAVIRNEFSTAVVAAFLEKFGQGSDTAANNLFVVIGQPLAWTTAPWSAIDDNTPPAPDASFADKAEAENYAIAAKRITTSGVQMIIPKVSWVSGVTYNLISTVTADPYAATDWYVITDLDEVFICYTKGGTTSTIKPLRSTVVSVNNGNNTTGVLGDGYEWEYMYTISGTAAKAHTTAWIPVNFGPAINLVNLENPKSFERLGVDNVMIIGEIDSSVLYQGDDYRQISVYKNLYETDGTTLATSNKYEIANTTWQDPTSEGDLVALVGLAASEMIYLENRPPILRSVTQVEELKIVLSMG